MQNWNFECTLAYFHSRFLCQHSKILLTGLQTLCFTIMEKRECHIACLLWQNTNLSVSHSAFDICFTMPNFDVGFERLLFLNGIKQTTIGIQTKIRFHILYLPTAFPSPRSIPSLHPAFPNLFLRSGLCQSHLFYLSSFDVNRDNYFMN